MMTTTAHLTTDELDTFLEDHPTARATSHIATCAECRAMVALDREVVLHLGALPEHVPSYGFADGVMARVTVGRAVSAPVAVPGTSRAAAARRRVVVAGGLTGAAVAGAFGWAILNPADALGFASPALQQGGHALWAGMQVGLSSAVDQPILAWVAEMVAAPMRTIPVLVAAAGVYAAALTGMRHLLTEPAPHARG
jgi:hypothetical protein